MKGSTRYKKKKTIRKLRKTCSSQLCYMQENIIAIRHVRFLGYDDFELALPHEILADPEVRFGVTVIGRIMHNFGNNAVYFDLADEDLCLQVLWADDAWVRRAIEDWGAAQMRIDIQNGADRLDVARVAPRTINWPVVRPFINTAKRAMAITM
jgi:hypothetical protein